MPGRSLRFAVFFFKSEGGYGGPPATGVQIMATFCAKGRMLVFLRPTRYARIFSLGKGNLQDRLNIQSGRQASEEGGCALLGGEVCLV